MKITTQQAVVVGGVAVIAYVLYRGAQTAATAINPLSDQNLAYQAVGGADGAVQGALDHYFAYIDLINPWADDYRRAYAWQVWGGGS